MNVQAGDYLGWYDEAERGDVFGYENGGPPACIISDIRSPRENSDVLVKEVNRETLVTRSYSVQACIGEPACLRILK